MYDHLSDRAQRRGRHRTEHRPKRLPSSGFSSNSRAVQRVRTDKTLRFAPRHG